MKPVVFAMVSLLLAGCATLDKAMLGDRSLRKPLDPLTLSVASDVYLLRADLNRSTHTRTETTTIQGADGVARTTTTTITEPDPYHYVAVDLGNGILLDYNHNLFLDLARFYGWADQPQFKITRQPVSFFEGKTVYQRKDSSFTEVNHSFFGGTRTAAFTPTTVAIVEPGFFGGRSTLTLGKDSIAYDPAGFLGLGAITITKPDDATVVFPSFWQDEVFRKLDANRVTLGPFLEVSHQGDSLEIQYKGLFGWDTRYTFFKTESGCVFFNNDSFQGVEVKRVGDRILVIQNRTTVAEYSIDQ